MVSDQAGRNADGTGQFSVRSEFADSTAVLHLVGEIDMGTAPRLDEALASVDPGTYRTVVLDMSRVAFIDSSGLNRLVVAMRRQRHHGGDLALRAPTDHVLRVLDMVGLSNVLTIEG